ncbi:DUF397 domain-containing protein [Streptomyces sp. SID9124]|uniref:DUF397 domain-containing protein n=1 Tax=Streptomyces sp. SID9124 TaxID=2706108 RepID=UPI0013E0DF6D|nr:DUF397 domain-containing protein [Streptomyces sp. SID9124]NED10834.1 DUF397 domain-containing protein [Streptomyces sp. SID9124]
MSAEPAWFKSSYSNDSGGACVEVALAGADAVVRVRDSKDIAIPGLNVSEAAWAAFTAEISA